jgi:hypothetical protein
MNQFFKANVGEYQTFFQLVNIKCLAEVHPQKHKTTKLSSFPAMEEHGSPQKDSHGRDGQ